MASLYNSKYYHRDLSWLRFNHRVLQEAADERNPLYERIKFLAIFSSNLDEFFRVRVSDIRQIKNLEKPLRKKLISKPNKVLKEIKNQVDIQQNTFGKIFKESIIPELKSEGIHLIDYQMFSETQKLVAKNYFKEEISDKLTVKTFPLSAQNEVFVENESLYLAGLQDDSFQIVEIPNELPRFFIFPKHNGKYYITFLDDILKYNLKQTPQRELPTTFYALKISRDAELYIEDEFSGNLMEKIKASLPKRNTGQATRVLMDQTMPLPLQQLLNKALDVNYTDVILGGTYHNFKDFFGFPNPTDKQLSITKLPPLAHPLEKETGSIFDAIDQKDQLLHYPYQSFESVIRLMEEAATDPKVTTIKITLYRIAEESRLNEGIAKAAKNGKKVIVFIEAKARFDEHNNLKWGDIFKKNGATVIYSYPGIKVHSKILYIEREIDEKTHSYAYIATGNFNEKTSTLYTDFGLMTAHPKLTDEINKVFLVLEGIIIFPKTKKLIVSPFSTRNAFVDLVENEIDKAESGIGGSIILKMNSLQDKNMIKLLYKASNAGVKIRLLIRGICSLIPGIKGQSENIYTTSVVDRFLEHGRVYIFGKGEDEKIYIGSADWMTRNLSHRIEVVTPILDKDHCEMIRSLINLQLADNVKARLVDAEQSNTYVVDKKKKLRSQYATYEFFKKLTE
ncbi:polyphosphate kinase 1 [Ulvibacter antarcticus]|uniref:Polyphosphate kinase n=1 Tax=Ulvibacter antarcticus TaxID=442714 RepID=A0A3L9YA87_9FLAO|nr:polyphosphate kinase 1 [Ulvibacter antarcticus]RMA57626.1 polyphosphate kinase [Ulvibacter antarcticus]